MKPAYTGAGGVRWRREGRGSFKKNDPKNICHLACAAGKSATALQKSFASLLQNSSPSYLVRHVDR
jgi:hypothetical protein